MLINTQASDIILTPNVNLILWCDLKLNRRERVCPPKVKRNIRRKTRIVLDGRDVLLFLKVAIDLPNECSEFRCVFLKKPLICSGVLNVNNFWVVTPTSEHRRICPTWKSPALP